MNSTAAVASKTATCLHHWIVEPPNGPISEGRCKRCGDHRNFTNNPDAAVWNSGETAADKVATTRR